MYSYSHKSLLKTIANKKRNFLGNTFQLKEWVKNGTEIIFND